jgi:hypothetical protein
MLLRVGVNTLTGGGNARRLYRRRRNSDRTVREDLLTRGIWNINTPSHTLNVGQLIVGRAFLVRRGMLLISAFCGFPGLIMTQMADIAFYTTSTRPFLRALKLVSRYISLGCDRRWQPVSWVI